MSRADAQRLRDYLTHIVDAIDNIGEYTLGMDAQAFFADRKTQDAVIRNFEVMGEACNNVLKQHSQFAKGNTHVPWSFAYEMRNVLAHGYFKVDLGIVWQTIQQELPKLRVSVHTLRDSQPPAD